jgi:methionine-rich copper-binding protein CopC
MFTIGASSAASAHANYLRSDPAPDAHLVAPPTQVLVGFSEKVKVASSGLLLLDSTGREVASQAQPTADPTELALPLPALSDGVYTVGWHTVSAQDGDPASGYFAFAVGTIPAVIAPGATQTQTQSGVTIALTISPNAPGKNGYAVTAKQGDSPLGNVTRVRLRITPSDRTLGQSEILLSQGTGFYGGSGYELPFAGRYHIEVQVSRSDSIDDLAFGYDVNVANAIASASPSAAASSPAAVVAPTTGAPAPTTEPLVPASTLLVGGALVLLAAIAGTLVARRRR